MKHIYISSCRENGGIYHYILENGEFVFKEKTFVDRPMYSVIFDNKLYVLLREIDFYTHFGEVDCFDIKPDGSLCNRQRIASTEGVCPCHLTVGETGIYVANYLSGNVVKINGMIDVHKGRYRNPPRQDMPHSHYINYSPDNNYLLSCDLGLDRIYTYDSDLNIVSIAKVPEGHGARHLAYSDDGQFVYCANELKSSVSVFSYSDGELSLKQTYPTLKKEINNTVAAIRVKDNYLYVSNRGEDSIVCFEIKGRRLVLRSRTSVMGVCPRDFNFCDNFLLSANEKSDNVAVFEVENENIRHINSINNIKNPLCITVHSIL